MGYDYPEQKVIQINQYKQCLIYVNNDLGMLIQNAENLAYKLGAIKPEDFHYLSFDYYKQYDKKDLWTLRKNIISSLKFLKAQFTAIKQETGKEYVFPPSIEEIKYYIKSLKNLIETISPSDAKFYDAIISFLEQKQFIDIDGADEIYKICYNNKKSDVNHLMWMNMSPPILNSIDKMCDENNNDNMPDIPKDVPAKDNKHLMKSNARYQDEKNINALLENKNENLKDMIIEKLNDFQDKYQSFPRIKEENICFYNKIIKDLK
jgi:hypothetical protein